MGEFPVAGLSPVVVWGIPLFVFLFGISEIVKD